jgi:hypothetical protein
MSIVEWWVGGVVGLVIAMPAVGSGQTRLTDAEQQAVEIAVAAHLVDRDELRKELPAGGLERLALDPRLYSIPVGRDWWGRRLGLDVSQVPKSHDEAHMAELSKLFSTHVISDAAGACVGEIPQPCRLGDHSGLIAFAPGVLKGDTARIVVHRWTPRVGKDPRPTKTEALSPLFWEVTLLRSGSTWRVAALRVFHP